jgi:mannosyltransferase
VATGSARWWRSTARGALGTARVAVPGLLAMTVLALIGLAATDAWIDEACSLAATVQYREVFRKTSGTMAGYYAVLNVWVEVSDSLWWIRFLSVLFAGAAVVVTGVVATRYRTASVARWACLLLGVSYMLVRYAREARSFAMLLLFVGLLWLALDRIVEGGPRRNWWTLVHLGLSAAVPLVHGLAVIPLFSQAIALLAARAPVRAWARVLPGYLAALTVVGLLYRMGASDVGAGGKLTFEGAEAVLLSLHGGLRRSDLPLLDPRYLILAATAYGAVLAIRRWLRAADPIDRLRAAAPAIWAFGTIGGLFVLSALRPQLVDRYAIAAIPALAILQADAAIHLQALLARAVRAPARWAVVPIVPVFLLAAFLPGQLDLHDETDRSWSDMVDVLAAEAEPGDGILVPRGGGRMPLDYAWSQHDGPLPEMVSISPTHDLGIVHRFGTRLPLDEAVARTSEVDRLWVLEVPMSMGDTAFQEAAYHPGLAWEFKIVDSWRFPAAHIVLLERR